MASGQIIRYLSNDVTNTSPNETSCNYAPIISLVYDSDGARGKYGNIMSVTPNAILNYEFVLLKYDYHVDIVTGGELLLNDFQLITGDHVWLNAQINPTQNGIYEVRDTSWIFIREVTPSVFVDLGARASDTIDGDLTRNIVVDYSSINFTETGFYSITYQVINSSGILSQKTRKVKVSPSTASISPVPGIKITQYDITAESNQKMALAQFGVSTDINTPQSNIDMGGGVIASPNSTLYIRKDGSIVFIANQSMGNNRLTDVADPVDGGDAINLRTLETAIREISESFTGLTPISVNVPASSIVNIDQMDVSLYRTIKWMVEVENTTLLTYYSSEILFVNTSSGGEFSHYGGIGDGNVEDFDISVVTTPTDIILRVANLTNNDLKVTFIRFKCS